MLFRVFENITLLMAAGYTNSLLFSYEECFGCFHFYLLINSSVMNTVVNIALLPRILEIFLKIISQKQNY